jgi:hypothetical protein
MLTADGQTDKHTDGRYRLTGALIVRLATQRPLPVRQVALQHTDQPRASQPASQTDSQTDRQTDRLSRTGSGILPTGYAEKSLTMAMSIVGFTYGT